MLLAVSGGLVAVLALLSTAPTLAAWNDREYGVATFQAGSVLPPTLACNAGLLQPVTFSWTPPSTGVSPLAYNWTFTGPGGVNRSGTVTPPTPLSLTFTTSGLSLGTTYTFTVLSVGPSPWVSTAVSGTASYLNVVLGLTSYCSVP